MAAFWRWLQRSQSGQRRSEPAMRTPSDRWSDELAGTSRWHLAMGAAPWNRLEPILDLEPRKQAMTLEHLLTMSSGYFCDDTNPEAPGNEEVMLDQNDEPDYYRFTLKVPMESEPGEKAVYCSINPNLALGAVGRAAGESPMDTFDRLLGIPMKINRYGWPLDPAGHPYGGGGVQLLPRDFMKFGQLMLDGGMWQGQRLLDRDFVARASAPLYHLRGITYGYLWWGIDFPYKNRTVHAFSPGAPAARRCW
jgi:CubicO group peptidase (beta-lactamase class C family)